MSEDGTKMPADRAPNTNLGRLLRTYRVVQEATGRELAERVGVASSTWSRLENGYMPDAETLVKLLQWLMQREK